jgi:Ca2+-binding EF-hand superfamily protein
VTIQFTLFDIDNDQNLSFQEMRVAFRALGFKIPRPELKQLLETYGMISPIALDQHRRKGTEPGQVHVSNLVLSKHAFLKIAAEKVSARDPAEEVERAFNLFDQDRKGYIVFEDLRRVAHELGETGLEDEELHAMINEFDFDGNGTVTRDTFFAILMD